MNMPSFNQAALFALGVEYASLQYALSTDNSEALVWTV